MCSVTGQEGNFYTQSLIGELASKHATDLTCHMVRRVMEGGLYPELCVRGAQLHHKSQNPPNKSDKSAEADSEPTGSQQTGSKQIHTACDGEGEILLIF